MSLDSENSNLDELTLQRLVDSELSHEQVRQLLAQAEFGDELTTWKTIALAFVENQMFECAFREKESAQAITDIPTISEGSTVVERPELSHVEEVTRQNSWWKAALAASLLLACAVVYQVSNTPKVGSDQLVQSPSTVDPLAVIAESKPIKSFDRVTLASYEPDHQLKAEDVDSASIGKHNSSIPLYNIGRLNPEQLAHLRGDDRAAREAMFAQVLPKSFSPEVVQQLQQSGGMIDQNLEFISGRLDDGRSYVIPYRTIRFLPGQ
jgi:hypothetical protein